MICERTKHCLDIEYCGAYINDSIQFEQCLLL